MNKKIITSLLSVLLVFTALFSSTPYLVKADDGITEDETQEVFVEEAEETDETLEEEDLPVEVVEEETIIEESETISGGDDGFELPPLTYRSTERDFSRFGHQRSEKNKYSALPASYSLVSEGLVTPVRNQNPYGTCWTFSAMGSAESIYLKKTGKRLDLSELQLAWFTYNSYGISDPLGLITFDGGNGVRTALDEGGNDEMAIMSMASGVGAIDELKLPYSKTRDVNGITDDFCYKVNYLLTDATNYSFYRNNQSSIDKIKQTLMEKGALSVAYCHDNYYLNTTTAAYYSPYYSNQTNHAVTLVGWDDNYSVTNFKSSYRPIRNGAWLIKNSWGSNWGNNGYFWISYEDDSLTGVYSTATAYEVTEIDASMTSIYQYDGSAGPYFITTNAPYSQANVFVAQKGGYLERASFYIDGVEMEYTIDIYTDCETTKPDTGTLATSVSGFYDNGGYHVVKLPEPVYLAKGQRYSIVVTINSCQGTLDVCYDSPNNWFHSQFISDIHPNESFEKTRYSESYEDIANRNLTARIKGFVSSDEIKIKEYGLEVTEVTGSAGDDFFLTTNYNAGLSWCTDYPDIVKITAGKNGTAHVQLIGDGEANIIAEYGGMKTEIDVHLGVHSNSPVVASGNISDSTSYILRQNGNLEIFCDDGSVVGMGDFVLSDEIASQVKVIYLFEGLGEIASNAFANCVNTVRIYLPSSINAIGDNAFPDDAMFFVDEECFAFEYVFANYPLQLSFGDRILVIYAMDSDNNEYCYDFCNEDGLVSEPTRKPEKDGYKFLYWEYDGEIFDFNYQIDSTIVLTPHFGKIINVSFEWNGEPIGLAPIVVVNDEMFGKLPVLEIKGYSFSGWSFAGKRIYENTIVESEEDIVLEAMMSPFVYDICFVQEGEGTIEYRIVHYGDEICDLPVPYLEGYVFVGWYTENGLKVSEGDIFVFDDDLVLFAKFIESGILSEDLLENDRVDFSGLWVAGIKNEMIATGKAVTQNFRVYFGFKRLYPGRDYTVSYKNNVKVSTDDSKAIIIIKGKGSFSGSSIVGSFDIVPAPQDEDTKMLSSKTVMVFADHPQCYYTGEPIEMGVTVLTKDIPSVLTRGVDYEVSYVNNINKGKATIYVTGINGYKGTVSTTFSILQRTIGESSVIVPFSYPYSKGGAKPPVKIDGLVEGVDYTVSYKTTTKTMTGTATIKGKGNYKGTVTKTFALETKNINETFAYADDVVYTGKPKLVPKVYIYDTDGNLLKEKTDYVITGYFLGDTPLTLSDVLKVGDVVRVEVSGVGMYEGQLNPLYASVVKQSLVKASVKVAAKMYTGVPVVLSASDLTVTLNKVPLGQDDYEIVAYFNNTLKGSGTVILKGVGEYGGYKAVKFKINAYKFS